MKAIAVLHMRQNKNLEMGERGERQILQEMDDKIGKIRWVKTSEETKPKKFHCKTGKCRFVSWGGITRKDLKKDSSVLASY